MSTPALVFTVIGLITMAAVVAVLIGLVRHAMILGRTLSHFQRDVGAIAQEITSEADRASSRAANIRFPATRRRA